MRKIFILLTLCCSIFFSCENNEPIIDTDNLLIGYWVSPTYKDDTTTYKRATALPKEGSGMHFMGNGNYVERTSGWCGTPPLTYFNVEGSFTLKDKLIEISTSNTSTNYGLRIISVSETELVVKRELTAQEIDHRALMDLYNEIFEIAYRETCTDGNNWLFTAFGSKACGGPQGYIPYLKSIDTVSFLNKVEAYTKAEKEYNIKWGVISDCALVNPPQSIDCKNGQVILNY